ncbi:MAG: hypothetical protein ABEN55_15530 [Bradymonadaceae bacterium]
MPLEPDNLGDEEVERVRGQLDQIWERLDQFEQDTIDLLSSKYLESVRAVRRQLEQLLDAAEMQEGRFVEDPELVAQARNEALGSVEATKTIWEEWRERLDEIESQLNDYYETAGDDPAGVGREELDALRGQWPQEGEPGTGMAGRFYNMSEHHRRQMADAVTRNVLNGASREQLTRELTEHTDMAERQARQRLRDSTIQYSRSVNEQKASELGYEYRQYFGPDDRLTRPFCDLLLADGPIWRVEDIREMNNGQTGAGTVLVAGGGYNCRHHWRPVKKWMVGEGQWEGMVASKEPPKFDESGSGRSPSDVDTVEAVTASGDSKALRVRQTERSPNPGQAELTYNPSRSGDYEVARYDPDLSKEDRRYAAIDNWVHGSNRKSSVLMKEAVRRELGIGGRMQSPLNYRYDDTELEAMRDDVRTIYDRTQESLQDKDTVTVYRGVALPEDMDAADYEQGVAESWTSDPEEAASHAKRNAGEGRESHLLEQEVSVDRVLMYHEGPEWHDGHFGNQGEYVILPDPPSESS